MILREKRQDGCQSYALRVFPLQDLRDKEVDATVGKLG
jgi:hypothetical protein